MFEIKNKDISVGINSYGAELEYIKINGIDILWKRSTLWNGQSPILFPNVGAMKDGFYLYDGKRYEIPSHGFMRNQYFEVACHHKDKITFVYKSNEKTLLQYPFNFELRVSYEVVETTLDMKFEIINKDDKDIFFGIGIHPGFSYEGLNKLIGEDYIFDFWPKTVREILFSPSYVSSMTDVKLNNTTQLGMSSELAVKRTLCYEGIKNLTIKGNNGSLTFINNMPYMAFWQKNPEGTSQFICVEGWSGLPDEDKTSHILEEKLGNNKLLKGHSYVTNFKIKYNKGEKVCK